MGCPAAGPGTHDRAGRGHATPTAMQSVGSTQIASHPDGLRRANPSGRHYGRSSLVMFGSPRREGIRSSSGIRQTLTACRLREVGRQASTTTGMIIGLRRCLSYTHLPTIRRTIC